MATYYIAAHVIKDAEKFEQYRVAAAQTIADFGGRYITQAGTLEVLFGQWLPDRVVIIEFDDRTAFRAWYDSPEYQSLVELRVNAADDSIMIIDRL